MRIDSHVLKPGGEGPEVHEGGNGCTEVPKSDYGASSAAVHDTIRVLAMFRGNQH